MNIQFTKEITAQPLLAVLVTEDNLSEILSDTPFSEHLMSWVENAEFKGKDGTTLGLPSGALKECGSVKAVLLVGTGKTDRLAGGQIGYFAKEKGFEGVTVYNANNVEVVTTQVVLGNYRFENYKLTPKANLETIAFLGDDNDSAAQRGIVVGEARNFARDLVNAPADDLYPESLAEIALELASENIEVEVWGEEKLLEEEMMGTLAVGRGSVNPPRFIHLKYSPTNKTEDTKKIVLVGKGITFDSGGLSLKSSPGMLTMRCDMGGSAVVMGVFHALQALQPDIEVHGLIAAAENMCAANSFKLGDILTYKNGKTVEIHNTDAEGRLVMADCLCLGSQMGADYMIDFATLTGACVVALGEHYNAVFTNEDDLFSTITDSANDVGERVWRLPLPEIYKKKLKGTWGELKNIGGRTAGSITAALYLSEFVSNTKWAHVDIAGPAFLDTKFEHFHNGGTGTMVESVLQMLTK
jgi:leucyl aminopeptidase